MNETIESKNPDDNQSVETVDPHSAHPAKKRPSTRRNGPPKSLHRQKGYGLVDVALAGLVGAFIVYGLYSQFGGSTNDAQSDNLTQQMTAMIGKISNNYGGDYSTISNTVVIANGYVNNRTAMSVSGSTIKIKPGNGTLTITPGQLQVANDAGTYTLTNLPDSSCTDMVSQLNGLAGQLSVNNTVVKPINGKLDPSLISCTTGQNTIVAIAD